MTEVTHVCAVLRDHERLLVVRRDDGDLWRGLWEFPRREARMGEPREECALRAASEVAGVRAVIGEPIVTIRHSVTRYRVALHALSAYCSGVTECTRPASEMRWLGADDLLRLPMAAPQVRVRVAALKGLDDGRPGL